MIAAYRPFDGDAWLGQDIPLADGPYRIMPESAFAVAEEMAFARQGRKARVFKLRGPDDAPYALKTFYRGFSLPEYVPMTSALAEFGDLPGLRTCHRRVIDEAEAAAIGEPGLTYAILMPWIEGVAWAGVVEGRFPLPADTCFALAAQTANVLAALEARGLAHADLSSSNVVVINSEAGPAVELIDVEDMYHDSLGPLPYMPDGSAGYAHPRNQGRGCRNRHGDRFAGAILLTELLVWSDPTVRESAADISVFEQSELCRTGPKYDLVRKLMQSYSAELAKLFERVWDSPGLAGCPRLAEWAAALATAAPADRPLSMVLDAVGVVVCPGCGLPFDHEPGCPLQPPAALAPTPGKSSFPGVPSNDNIGFIPLFGA